MAKKIRFPLKLAEETEVRTLEELREHFDLQAVLEYYKNGKLLTWLDDRYLEGEAEAIRALDESAPDFQQRLCSVFQVEYTGAGVDMEEIERRQERLKRLRTITDEAEYIQNIDMVAFDQEELADLLDEGQSTIYLCGEKFTVPASRKGITYVGINEPAVHISGKVPETAEELEIVFTGITCDNLPEVTAKAAVLGGFAQTPKYTKDQYEMLLNAELYRLNPDVIPTRDDFSSAVVPERTADGSFWTVIDACEPGMIWTLRNQNGVEVELYFGSVMTGEKILRRALMMAANVNLPEVTAKTPGLDGSVHLPTYTKDQYEMLLSAELYRLNPDVIPNREDFSSAVVPERTADGSCWTVIDACEPSMIWTLLNQNGVEVELYFGSVMTGEKILRRALMMAATSKEGR